MTIRKNPQGPAIKRKPKWSNAEKDILRNGAEQQKTAKELARLLPGRTIDSIDRRLKLLRAGQDITLPLRLMRMGNSAKVTVLHPDEPGIMADCHVKFQKMAASGSAKLLAAMQGQTA